MPARLRESGAMPEPLRKVVPSERGEAQETARNPQIAPVPPVERGEAAETARTPQIAPVEERSRKATARCPQGARAAPRPCALGVVRAPAARTHCRGISVRHRRQVHVDGRRLCPGREGRHLDRRVRYREGGRRHRQPARRGRSGPLSARSRASSRSRSTMRKRIWRRRRCRSRR